MKSDSTTAGHRRVPIALLMLTIVVAVLQSRNPSPATLAVSPLPILAMAAAIGGSAQTDAQPGGD